MPGNKIKSVFRLIIELEVNKNKIPSPLGGIEVIIFDS